MTERAEFPGYDEVSAEGFDGSLRGLDGRPIGEPVTWAELRFRRAFREFYRAGMRLVDAWDDEDDGFHADEMYPLPAELVPPMSLDDWMAALLAHYAREERE